MWSHFEGKARTRAETLEYLGKLKWTDWRPQGITLHNTAAPTLKQWAESGPLHDARIRNLQNYYEQELGWHAGPHFFVSRNFINWFSDPTEPGVHSRCWNATRFGIEMVGDYNAEPFNSGDGALVRDNAVFLMAALNNKFGFRADDLTFHVECKRDNHDCPGKNVVKADVISRVKAEMVRQGSQPAQPAPAPIPIQPAPAPIQPAPAPIQPASRPVMFQARGKMSTFGGPKDRGMSSDEGLALFSSSAQMVAYLGGEYVLSVAAAGASGLGRRLNPETHYVACRWPVSRYPFLRQAIAWVENPADHKKLAARPADWGPNVRTGRVADLSPALARDLGLDTDGECVVTVYEDGK